MELQADNAPENKKLERAVQAHVKKYASLLWINCPVKHNFESCFLNSSIKINYISSLPTKDMKFKFLS